MAQVLLSSGMDDRLGAPIFSRKKSAASPGDEAAPNAASFSRKSWIDGIAPLPTAAGAGADVEGVACGVGAWAVAGAAAGAGAAAVSVTCGAGAIFGRGAC
jgi:hypothetical protein